MNSQNQSLKDPSASKAQAERIAHTVEAAERDTGPGFWTWAVMILAGLYALMGAIDILPDVIPVIGELDDAGALLLFFRMAARIFNTDFGIRKTAH